jgi:hypothetical protein
MICEESTSHVFYYVFKAKNEWIHFCFSHFWGYWTGQKLWIWVWNVFSSICSISIFTTIGTIYHCFKEWRFFFSKSWYKIPVFWQNVYITSRWVISANVNNIFGLFITHSFTNSTLRSSTSTSSSSSSNAKDWPLSSLDGSSASNFEVIEAGGGSLETDEQQQSCISHIRPHIRHWYSTFV